MSESSEKYERWVGISVGVDLGQDVIIDVVSKEFDEKTVRIGYKYSKYRKNK